MGHSRDTTQGSHLATADINVLAASQERIAQLEEKLRVAEHQLQLERQERKATEDSLKDQIALLTKQLAEQAAEADALRETVKTQQDRIHELEQLVESLQQQLQASNDKCSALEAQIQASTLELECAQQQILQQGEQLRETEKMLKDANERANQLEEELLAQKQAMSTVEAEILSVNNLLAKKDEEIVHLKSCVSTERQGKQGTEVLYQKLIEEKEHAVAEERRNLEADRSRLTLQLEEHSRVGQRLAQMLENERRIYRSEKEVFVAELESQQLKIEELQRTLDAAQKDASEKHSNLQREFTDDKDRLSSELARESNERVSLAREVTEKSHEILSLKEQLDGKEQKIMMLKGHLESLEHEFQSRAATIHRSRALNPDRRESSCSPDHKKLKKDAKRLADNRCSFTDQELHSEQKESVLNPAEFKGKIGELAEVIARAHGGVSIMMEARGPDDEVIALECVLMDAVTLCEAIYKLCDGSEKDESSMIPDDASSECEWKWNVGPGGLLGMEDELRNILFLGQKKMGHHNPKQRIQYHLRLKWELEELRRECVRLLREKFQLEQCIRYLAARCHLFQAYSLGRDVSGQFDRSAADQVLPESLQSTVRYQTPLGRRMHKWAGRGMTTGKEQAPYGLSRDAMESAISEVQQDTTDEANGLLQDVRDAIGPPPQHSSRLKTPRTSRNNDQPTSSRGQQNLDQEELRRQQEEERRSNTMEKWILKKVATVCIPMSDRGPADYHPTHARSFSE